MISAAAVCIAGQFTFNKLYEKKVVTKIWHLLLFPVLTSSVLILLFLSLNGFSLEVGGFTIMIAALTAVVSSISMLCGILVVRQGSVAVYTVFMMLGGMFLPYVYGLIFLQEQATVFKIVGLIVLVASLILSVFPVRGKEGQRPKKAFYFLCVLIFFLNGSISILSKVHQIAPQALPTYNYLIWNYIIQFVLTALCFSAFILLKRKDKEMFIGAKDSLVKGSFISVAYALVSGSGFLLQLLAARSLPASILFPFETGASIILTTFAARIFFKEKIRPFMWLSLALMLIGTILFVF